VFGRADDDDREIHGVGDVIRELMEDPTLGRGLPLGRLVRAWEGVVGAPLALHTAPKTLSEGTLIVAASTGAWAVQVRFLGEEIIRRANEALGDAAVRRVRVVVAR
jgi:predicted nucleic acid-binding Zn ribbon protein